MSFKTVKFEINGPIGELTISRPESLNALNGQVLEDLNSVLEEIEKNDIMRCLIITGAGEKSFVAGADIKEMDGLDSNGAREFSRKGHQVFRRLEVLDVPSIAAVNGFCLGGGLELALACDFIIASENAVLGLPEVTLGLIPGFGGTQRLSRAVGESWSRRLITSAEKLTAEDAKRINLVTEVTSQADLLGQARKLAEKISRNAPVAIKNARRVIGSGLDRSIDEALIIEQDGFGDLFRTKDVKEGLSAFKEKRKPTFLGE